MLLHILQLLLNIGGTNVLSDTEQIKLFEDEDIEYAEDLETNDILLKTDAGAIIGDETGEGTDSDNDDNSSKRLKIKDYENIIEGNLADLPIFLFMRPKKVEIENDNGKLVKIPIVMNDNNIMKIEWEDSKGNRRALEQRGSAKYGLLQFGDIEILLACMKAHFNLSDNNVIPYTGSGYNFPTEYYFTYSEVARILGYKSCGGSTLQMIDVALQRMTDVSIWNTIEGGLYDAKNKNAMTDRKTGNHVIEKYDAYDYKEMKVKGMKRDDYRYIRNYIRLSDFFNYSMCQKYFKFIDYDLFVSMKQSVSKKIYLIIHKWRNNRKEIKVRFETLYARIPLSDEMPEFRKKQYIKDAVKELIMLSYLQDVRYEKDRRHQKDYVVFVFPDGKLLDSGNVYNTLGDVKKAMVEKYGFEMDVANALIDFNMNSRDFFDYILAFMRYADQLSSMGGIKDNIAFIKDGLTSRYNIPRKFYK
jgi:hypothetical protein